MEIRKDTMTLDTGLVELDINGVRTIKFNPSDVGFAEDLYGLASKIGSIQDAKEAEFAKTEDPVVKFDISRAEDKEMRAAVDDYFGEGFCADLFPGVRLYALADGMTLIENLLYGLLDKMDEDITANIARRDAKMKKYTDKYRKYSSKYHR